MASDTIPLTARYDSQLLKCIFNSSCEKHFRKQNILLLLNTTHSEVSLLFGNETLMHKSKQFINAGSITLGSNTPNDKDSAYAQTEDFHSLSSRYLSRWGSYAMTKMQTCSPALSRTPRKPHCPFFATRTWLLDVWTFSCLVMLNRRIIKKVHEASNFAYHLLGFWVGRNQFFQGEAFLLCYWAFIPPSALAPNPFSIQLNVIYILPHSVVSQREGGRVAGVWQWHRRKSNLFFCLKLQFSSSKTMPTVQRKLWLCKMDGHITPFFAIGYNLRSSSPGKSLPPPTLALFSPFQMTSLALQTHFTH